MAKVAVVTDSNTCLPPEIIKDFNIGIVPISLQIDGKVYRDQVDISQDEFWKLFKNAKKYSISAPALSDFTKAFQEASKETNEIACVVLSGEMSCAYETALQAKNLMMAENPALKIEIVDSRSTLGAEGFIAIEGARAARAGSNLDEIIRAMEGLVPGVKWIAAMDTAKYTVQLGRAPKTTYTGNLPQVKVLLAQLHGTAMPESAGNVRGKNNCFQRMMEIIETNTEPNKPIHAMVHHAGNVEDAEQLKVMLKEKFDCAELFVTPYPPAVCMHSGPNGLAIAFYQ